MFRIDGDRRKHRREPLERPCKIYDPRSMKYIAATTRDVSSGGMLIDVPRLLEIKPGERLFIGVAMTRRQGFIQAKEMIDAVVLRAAATVDDHTTLAVSFEAPAVIEQDAEVFRAAA